jgi:glutathione S-transferase
MLTLYFAPGTSSMAPHIALHEIGVAFEARPMGPGSPNTGPSIRKARFRR